MLPATGFLIADWLVNNARPTRLLRFTVSMIVISAVCALLVLAGKLYVPHKANDAAFLAHMQALQFALYTPKPTYKYKTWEVNSTDKTAALILTYKTGSPLHVDEYFLDNADDVQSHCLNNYSEHTKTYCVHIGNSNGVQQYAVHEISDSRVPDFIIAYGALHDNTLIVGSVDKDSYINQATSLDKLIQHVKD